LRLSLLFSVFIVIPVVTVVAFVTVVTVVTVDAVVIVVVRGSMGKNLFPFLIVSGALSIYRLLLFLLAYLAGVSAEMRSLSVNGRLEFFLSYNAKGAVTLCHVSGMFTYNEKSRTYWFSKTCMDNDSEFNLVGVVSFK